MDILLGKIFSIETIEEMEDGVSGVYEISFTNREGKRYIGSSHNIRKRWKEHQSLFKTKKHHSRWIKNIINKEGFSNIRFRVLEITENDKESILRCEQKHIDLYPFHTLYNSLRTAGSKLGYKTSEETKEKIRIGNTGKKLTPETIEKIRASSIGKKHTPEAKEKVRAARAGKKHTPEAKEKVRIGNTGKKRSPETIERMRAVNIGKKLSAETKEKLRLANTGKKITPETIARRIATRAANRQKKLELLKLLETPNT